MLKTKTKIKRTYELNQSKVIHYTHYVTSVAVSTHFILNAFVGLFRSIIFTCCFCVSRLFFRTRIQSVHSCYFTHQITHSKDFNFDLVVTKNHFSLYCCRFFSSSSSSCSMMLMLLLLLRTCIRKLYTYICCLLDICLFVLRFVCFYPTLFAPMPGCWMSRTKHGHS